MAITNRNEYCVRCDIGKAPDCWGNTTWWETAEEAKTIAFQTHWKETKEGWKCPACQKEKPRK